MFAQLTVSPVFIFCGGVELVVLQLEGVELFPVCPAAGQESERDNQTPHDLKATTQ